MRINEGRLSGATVLELHGELASPDARDHLITVVRKVTQAPSKDLVLDLADVPFVDAGGIGALLVAYSLVKRVGGTLRLARVGSRVHALLVVCRLMPPFETFRTIEAAAAHGMVAGMTYDFPTEPCLGIHQRPKTGAKAATACSVTNRQSS
jgi:anti-sigma B factor antagonist